MVWIQFFFKSLLHVFVFSWLQGLKTRMPKLHTDPNGDLAQAFAECRDTRIVVRVDDKVVAKGPNISQVEQRAGGHLPLDGEGYMLRVRAGRIGVGLVFP